MKPIGFWKGLLMVIIVFGGWAMGSFWRGENFAGWQTWLAGTVAVIYAAHIIQKMAAHIDSLEDRIAHLEMSTGFKRSIGKDGR